jgi:hypothetical protein
VPPDFRRRLALLADAARFDAPCAARVGAPAGTRAGTPGRRDATGRRARAVLPVLDEAHVERSAIYHSVGADGRRVPLLKLLLTNHCAYDCAYCPLRRSADAERARLTVGEVVRLTIDYHRRGLVDGLFLSAAVDASADDTMARLVAVARTLRLEHHFAGYVHLKVVPEASPELVDEAGRWADRVSVNVELARQQDLDALAPGRRLVTIHAAMDRLRDGIAEAHEARVRLATAHAGRASWTASRWRRAALPRFAPPGRSRRWWWAPTGRATPTSCAPRPPCTGASGCAASTSAATSRSRARPTGSRPPRRAACASAGSTRPTGWCGSTASRSTSWCHPTRPTSPPTSTRRSPGRCATPSASRST